MSRQLHHAGPVRHVLAYLLTLMLALCLVCAVFGTALLRLDRPGDLFARVTDAALDLQEARVRETIVGLADTYYFDPAPVCALFPRERFRELNAGSVDWWRQLPEADAAFTPPVFADSAIAELVRNDPAFQEATDPTMRRIIAEDRVAYVICQAVQNAVYPIRTPLVSAAMPRVTARVNVARILPLLRLVLPAMVGASVLLVGLLWVLMRRCGAWGYIGSGMVAAALTGAALMLIIHRLDLAGQAGLVSPVLAAELRVLGQQLALLPGLCCGLLAVFGIVLTIGTASARKEN